MQRSKATLKATACCIVLLVAQPALAHNINYAMERVPVNNVFWFYLKMGVEHIVPLGLDHILFIIALCLLNTKLKTIIWQATAFTVAHCITLALSAKGLVELPADVVEPIIAMSIAFIAIENILLDRLQPWRILLVFLFGLIHGLGFASVLDDIGLPRNYFFTSILAFNIGVEIGQIFIIAAVYFLLIRPFGHKPWYKKRIVYPISILIALAGIYWTIERIFF